MIVDLKVHVEIVHYEGRQGSNMRPRESYFLSLRKSCFFAKDFTNNFNMRPLRKINVGFAKDSQTYFFIREEWPFADKSNLDQPHTYIYIYIIYYNI